MITTLAMLVTLSLGAQAPRILSVAPTSGPITGSTQVHVEVSEPEALCLLPVTPMVGFGDSEVVAEFVSERILEATTPPHSAGVVDLTAIYCGVPKLVARNAFTFFDPATDPDPADFEKVLLPVFFFGQGMHQSEWVTEATVYNEGPEAVEFANPIFEGDPTCPALCGCSARSEIQAGERNRICSQFAQSWGLILWAPESGADQLHYSLRVRDLSRQATSAGTEIPVIHEQELRSGTIVLLDVPADSRFRSTLRLFDVQGRDGMQVRMRIHADDEEEPRVDTILTLRQSVVNIMPDPFPTSPSYGYVGDLTATFPVLAGAAMFRVDLEPLEPLERFWAFVSITNNDTQQITVVTPQ
ncbi:MAG TPA: IPT/TIG domain-containing protein [Thermoanaerobaculia bacterium]|nr:IPT/TIG domain-containing protein [Thermoanaerobaculia bacterium]